MAALVMENEQPDVYKPWKILPIEKKIEPGVEVPIRIEDIRYYKEKTNSLFYLRNCSIDLSFFFFFLISYRDKIIKDLQDNIRMEQQYEKERKEFEAEEAKNRQKQLEQTHAILSRHWTAYMKNILKLEEEENVSIYNLIEKLCYLNDRRIQ